MLYPEDDVAEEAVAALEEDRSAQEALPLAAAVDERNILEVHLGLVLHREVAAGGRGADVHGALAAQHEHAARDEELALQVVVPALDEDLLRARRVASRLVLVLEAERTPTRGVLVLLVLVAEVVGLEVGQRVVQLGARAHREGAPGAGVVLVLIILVVRRDDAVREDEAEKPKGQAGESSH